MPHLSSATWAQPSQPAERDDDDEESQKVESNKESNKVEQATSECNIKDADKIVCSASELVVQVPSAPPVKKVSYIRRGRSMDCTCFPEEDIRRGVPITSVLALFGFILGTSKGSAATYELSRPVERLGVFISHNWSTTRLPKFLTLAYHFNFIPALALCLAIDLVGATLGGLHYADALRVKVMAASIPVQFVPCFCTVATCFVFPAVLLFGHDIWSCCGRRKKLKSPVVFLDKICIHQTDKVRQRKGIENLSAFLEASDQMLVVYTDTYLGRLWTVYEMATMLIVRENPAIIVIPTEVVAILCIAWGMMIVYLIMHLLVSTVETNISLSFGKALVGLVTLPFMVELRRWAKNREKIWSHAKEFSIRRSVCAVEDDRVVVYGNVCILMRVCGYVPESADDEAALDAFDELARMLVPLHLQNSWGRCGLPWRCGFSLSPVWLAMMADVLGSPALWNATPSRIVCHTCIWLVIALVASPLWAALAAWVAGRYINLKGLEDKIFLATAWLGVCGVGVAMYYAAQILWVTTWDQPELVWVVAPACCGAIAVTVQLYYFRNGAKEQEDRIKTDCRAASSARFNGLHL